MKNTKKTPALGGGKLRKHVKMIISLDPPKAQAPQLVFYYRPTNNLVPKLFSLLLNERRRTFSVGAG
jgi:hypothetical protein